MIPPTPAYVLRMKEFFFEITSTPIKPSFDWRIEDLGSNEINFGQDVDLSSDVNLIYPKQIVSVPFKNLKM